MFSLALAFYILKYKVWGVGRKEVIGLCIKGMRFHGKIRKDIAYLGEFWKNKSEWNLMVFVSIQNDPNFENKN